jgi:hypothetical protein
MSYSFCPRDPIEEIDLTGDSDPEASQTKVPMTLHPIKPTRYRLKHKLPTHLNLELYVLNHQQSLLNNTTIWHRNTSGSFHATEQLDSLLYKLQRMPYLNKGGEFDHKWAEKTWEQWERESHPAVEAFEAYNNPPSPEMVRLQSVKESLRRGDVAAEGIRKALNCADEALDVAAMAPKSRVSDGMPAAMKEIFDDLNGHLRSVEKAQRVSKKQLELLEPAVKSLVSSPPAHPTIHTRHTLISSTHSSSQSPSPTNSTRKENSKTKRCLIPSSS